MEENTLVPHVVVISEYHSYHPSLGSAMKGNGEKFPDPGHRLHGIPAIEVGANFLGILWGNHSSATMVKALTPASLSFRMTCSISDMVVVMRADRPTASTLRASRLCDDLVRCDVLAQVT